jgi:hypothetical protein
MLRIRFGRWIGFGVAALLAGSAVALPVAAQGIERPDAPNALHSVWVYKLVCYDPMPDTAALEKLATTYGFRPMSKAAVVGFAPQVTPTYLKGWEVDDHGRTFKVAASIAPVDAELAAQFPAFAKGTATGCTVILPAKDDPKAVSSAMKKLNERDPDTTYEAGPFNVALWVGQTADHVFLIYHYGPKTGKPGGLLSIVTLSK